MAEPGANAPMGNTERNWGMACHLAALAGFIIPVGGGLLGPLVVYLVKHHEFPFVDDQGKESLNFQITMVIAYAVSGLLVLAGIGIFLVAAVSVYETVMIIIASVQASNGVWYRYPICLRFIR
jgi:uncharacterized Tic20 family protein